MVKCYVIIIMILTSTLACSGENSIVLLLDIQGSRPVVVLDGNIIEKENMYNALMQPLNVKGRDSEVNVLFNSKLSFSEVVNTRGLIQAVGFDNITFYYLSDDKKKMAELEFNKQAIIVPFDLRY